MSARGFLGAGDLYISRFVNGAFEDFKGPYECSKFEIKPNIELRELTSRGKNTYGQVIESVALQQPADITVDLPEVNRESLSIALLGTAAALSQTAGSLTDEEVVAKLDAWVPLSKAAWSAAPTVTNQAGDVTYVAGADYIVNADLGWIKALPGGDIVDGSTISVSVAYGAITGTEIKGATSADVRARFKLDGKNQADGLPCIVTVYEVVVAADSAFDFLADDFNTVSLPGRMKTPAGFTEPFTVHLRNAAA